jgi:hypothetical protein
MSVKVTITSPANGAVVNPTFGVIQVTGTVDTNAVVTVQIDDDGFVVASTPTVATPAANWSTSVSTNGVSTGVLVVIRATAKASDNSGVGSHSIRATIGAGVLLPADGGGDGEAAALGTSASRAKARRREE